MNWMPWLVGNELLGVSGPRYLNHVHPLSDVEEATLAGDVVQQQHAVRAAEIGLGDAAEPGEKQTTHTLPMMLTTHESTVLN